MFGRKGSFVSLANRKVRLEGHEGTDYTVNGVVSGILLHTCDTEYLVKNKRHVVNLNARAVPTDRCLGVKVNPYLYKVAMVTGPAWIDPEDDGEIRLVITPRVDVDLSSMDYIVKLLVEGV